MGLSPADITIPVTIQLDIILKIIDIIILKIILDMYIKTEYHALEMEPLPRNHFVLKVRKFNVQ